MWLKFEVLVDGREGSNMPGVAECFLLWFITPSGLVAPPVPGPLPAAGREKLCDAPPVVLILRFEAEAACEAYSEGGTCRVLVMVILGRSVPSASLSEESTRRGGGRVGGAGACCRGFGVALVDEEDGGGAPGMGEKLPGARCGRDMVMRMSVSWGSVTFCWKRLYKRGGAVGGEVKVGGWRLTRDVGPLAFH